MQCGNWKEYRIPELTRDAHPPGERKESEQEIVRICPKSLGGDSIAFIFFGPLFGPLFGPFFGPLFVLLNQD